MPKDDRKSRSDGCSRASPYDCSSSSRHRSSQHSESRPEQENSEKRHEEWEKNIKEWNEVRCPVCMEQPHNAVLLICASFEKGCRPFMCDTSYRHSNCLDQYRKSSAGSTCGECQQKASLACPLCRGVVSHWMVVDAARDYMNLKVRSCSLDSCDFTGVYKELRKHARKEHPAIRPSEADPERQADWQRMERQRDIGDLVSVLRSSLNADDISPGSNDEEEYNGRVYSSFPLMVVLLMTASRADPEGASAFVRGSRNGGGTAVLLLRQPAARSRGSSGAPPQAERENANSGNPEDETTSNDSASHQDGDGST